jgi:hypothetical protein
VVLHRQLSHGPGTLHGVVCWTLLTARVWYERAKKTHRKTAIDCCYVCGWMDAHNGGNSAVLMGDVYSLTHAPGDSPSPGAFYEEI